MKYTRSIFFLMVIGLLACQKEYFPPGLYGYQVLRLVDGGSGKVWTVQSLEINGESQSMDTCINQYELHATVSKTAVDLYQLNSCNPVDTVYYGAMTATSAGNSGSNKNLFTDSLLFTGGRVNYVIVKYITSQTFDFERVGSGKRYSYHCVSE